MLVISEDALAVLEGVVLEASVDVFELDELEVELGEVASVACGVLLL